MLLGRSISVSLLPPEISERSCWIAELLPADTDAQVLVGVCVSVSECLYYIFRGVGCIFLEMITGTAAFQGLKDPDDQLDRIFRVCIRLQLTTAQAASL